MSGKGPLKVARGNGTFTVETGEKSAAYVPTPLDERLCGVRLSNIEGYARLKFKLRQQKGVVVTKVMKGGLGERYGLRPGDVIIRINNAEVADKGAFTSAYGGRFAKELYSLSGEEERHGFFPPDKTRHLTLGGMMEAEKETSAGKAGKGKAKPDGEDAGKDRAERSPDNELLYEFGFSTFILSLSTSALVHLGELPDPFSNTKEVNLQLAKQTISIIEMLKEKTKGNLTKEEENLIDSVLYDVRLKFISSSK